MNQVDNGGENVTDADGSVLKWHLTKWVPQFKIEEGDIKMDLRIFYILIFLVILVFLCILITVLLTGFCFNQQEVFAGDGDRTGLGDDDVSYDHHCLCHYDRTLYHNALRLHHVC